MALFQAFRAVRPASEKAEKVAALPYDVVSREEARKIGEKNPESFLHIDRAEMDLDPETDLYDPMVYQKARENLDRFQKEGILIQDEKPNYYLYELIRKGRSQTGIVGVSSIDDYMNGVIKKHELTREDKEQDRIRHVDVCDANTGPIFLACRYPAELLTLMEEWKNAHVPVYDFTSDDEITHRVWVVDEEEKIRTIHSLFGGISSIYIADGHHRAASAVKVGQKIGEAAGFISAPVHSSVSGTVVAVEPRMHGTRGSEVMAVVIESDGKNTLHESVQPHKALDELTPDEIIEIVKEAGIVGMGGAGFPTCVKLKPAKPVDTILLNGCECEPYLTADHKVLLEFADDIIFGLKAILKTTGAEKGIIVIEDNKQDAIELMQEKVADIGNMEVFVARTKYPQGAEKTLIKRVMGRKVPSGGLPADVGVIVDNISTVKAISDAIQKGMPLIERVATVTGEKIKNPGNFIIKIGTSVKELIDYCGGFTDDDVLVKMGGPMMGFPLNTLEVPMMKGSNGIIAIDTDETKEQPCIKCGRCVDVCPMELSPLYFVKYAKEENWQGMKDMNVMDCVECRCCQYICSSKIPIINSIKAGKNAVRGMK